MIPELDKSYWEQRYRRNETGWDIGEISPPLKEYIDQLSNNDLFILIPGAGNAYEAEYLVKKGFKNVFVCDLAAEPLNNLQKRIPELHPGNLLQGDFFDISLEHHFDLIIEQTFFCAINPALRRGYFEKIHALLKPGGRLVGLLFNDKLNSDHPPFGGNKEEYLEYFSDLFVINVYEQCYNSVKPRAGRELFINLSSKNKIHNL